MPPFETLVPDVLTVCTYVRFAPFCYEQAGRIVGTDIDFLTRFGAREGLETRFEAVEFPGMWERPGREEYDVAAAGLAALDERDPGHGGRWSVAYSEVRRSLLIRRSDVERLSRPEDFRGKTIVVTADSAADVDARARYSPLGADVLPELATQDEMVQRLVAGTVDAYGGGETSNRFVAASEPSLAVVDVHSMEPKETLHFAVRSRDPALLERLNAFIEAAAT